MDENLLRSRLQQRMSISHSKGLTNLPGQNNCFLNSAVQVLWHLDIFRRSFRELSGHACMADSCIFCALKELFNQFQYSLESALPPDALRFALAEAFSDQRRFQLGFMDDAAECFENILLRIHCHIANKDSEDMCNVNQCLPHCIPHQKFAMNLIEQIVCHACGATSEPLPFTQMVHYVSTPALCVQAKQFDREIGMTFGELLKSAGAVGDIRDCPRSCGAKIQIKKSLINKPDIVSIGLVWDSERPTINHIMDVFRAIGIALHVPDVFDTVSDCRESKSMGNVLQLVGLVTYYGKHYSTFFFHTKLREWIYFDDAAVRAIGPHWEQVVDKCIRGHFQPLLLLYANPNGTPVNTDCAPKEVTPLTVNRNIHRSYSSSLQAKCDPTNKFSIKTMPRNSHQSINIFSDTETNNYQMIPHNDKINLNLTRNVNRRNDETKMIPPLHTNYSNTSVVRPVLSNLSINEKIKFNYLRCNNMNMNMNESKHLKTDTADSVGSDVPDSPNSKCSLSYFSDIGELDSGYISRKTVESILNLQRHSLKKKAGNRNSSSSLDSFDMRNGSIVNTLNNNNQLLTNDNTKPKVCSLQRHDSGNSSGDRNSASSASISSVESPYYPFMAQNRRLFLNASNYRHPWNTQMGSDQGYDSFSLSSTDSYPSAVGPCGPSSPGKMNMRLTQIPEDIQLMELINASTMLDCDKLCSEADILLLKSHEKEREGDLRAAAALSDSAAQKARSAMDAPYSNHQTLITAKMKHSMCVMRSASLHKRVKELEAEEKRRLKAESVSEFHHSRQSSRDSTHSRHSRQGSKDSKDGKSKEFITKHASLEMNKNRQNANINEGGIAAAMGKTVEIYATLPKKGSKKKLFQQSITSLSSLRIKSDDTGNGSASLYKDFTFKPSNTIDSKKKIESNKKTVSPIISDKTVSVSQTKSPKCEVLKSHCRESDFSDYYSEWEATRKSLQRPLQRTLSGSASCRENDSEYYGEVGNYQSAQSTVKKQHKVRRRLLMGGFMKRKNRSLPDLREGLKPTQSPPNELPAELSHDDLAANTKTIAQISSKGFHQSHRAFYTEHGLYQRPSLLKVNPPLIEKSNKPMHLSNHSTHTKIDQSLAVCTPTMEKSKRTNSFQNHLHQSTYEKSLPPLPNESVVTKSLNTFSYPTDSPLRPPTPIKSKNSVESECNMNDTTFRLNETNFLKELALKREEIMKYKNSLKLTENKVSNTRDDLNKALIKPNMKVPQMGYDECDNNEMYKRLQSVELSANSKKNDIIIAKNHSSQTLMHQNVASNSYKPVNKTLLHSPPLETIKTDPNSNKNSVKDLASKFEKIMFIKHDNKVNQTTDQLNNMSDHSEQIVNSCDSLRKAEAVTSNCSDNYNDQNVPIIGTPVVPSFESNKPTDDYKMQSNVGLPLKSAIPININSNCMSSPNLPHIRPNRPPDYQTAIKRIGMLRNDRIALNGFSPQTRPFYMNVNGNIVQHSQQLRNNNLQPQSLTLPNTNQLQQTDLPKTAASDKSIEQTDMKEQSASNTANKTIEEPIRKRSGFKKSVSFSDQVVLVACAEDEDEEYLPNPLLERILNKNNLNSGQQSI